MSGSTVDRRHHSLGAVYCECINVAPIMTISASVSMHEAAAGTSETQFWSSLSGRRRRRRELPRLWPLAIAARQAAISSSATTSSLGLGVNAIGSSPYSVTVGGTQFNDTANPSAHTGPRQQLHHLRIGVELHFWNRSGTPAAFVRGRPSHLWAGGGGSSIVFSKSLLADRDRRAVRFFPRGARCFAGGVHA